MKIVGNIPHPKMTITVFVMNEKYLVKFEAGPMEQVYKLSQDKAKGFENVQKIVDEQFQAAVLKKFGEMFEEMRNALDRSSTA
jgi:hypothetical protein